MALHLCSCCHSLKCNFFPPFPPPFETFRHLPSLLLCSSLSFRFSFDLVPPCSTLFDLTVLFLSCLSFLFFVLSGPSFLLFFPVLLFYIYIYIYTFLVFLDCLILFDFIRFFVAFCRFLSIFQIISKCSMRSMRSMCSIIRFDSNLSVFLLLSPRSPSFSPPPFVPSSLTLRPQDRTNCGSLHARQGFLIHAQSTN